MSNTEKQLTFTDQLMQDPKAWEAFRVNFKERHTDWCLTNMNSRDYDAEKGRSAYL